MRFRKDVTGIGGIEELTEFEVAAAELLAQQLREAINRVGASSSTIRFLEAIVARNIVGAEQALSWTELTNVIAGLQRLLAEQILRGADLGLPSIATTFIGEFDAANQFSVDYAQRSAARLIVDITTEQQALIRDLITKSVRDGLSVDEVSDIISRSIGLHERWATAVNRRYETLLDSLLQSGVGRREAKRRARLASQEYHDYLLDVRARTIARTEILDAHNAGRWAGWQDAIANGLVPANARKTWKVRVPSRADSPCPICLPLDGEEVKWDEEFSSGVMMPPLHPNCVCTATLLIGEYDEFVEAAG